MTFVVIDIAFMALILWAVISDFLKLRIANAVSVGLVLLFCLFAIFSYPRIPLSSHLLSFTLVFSGAILLYYFNVMGGGDVKFLAATSLWVGLGQLLAYLVAVALIGGLLTLLLLALRLMMRRHSVAANLPISLRWGQPVPYGVAIGLGALLFRCVQEFARYLVQA